MDTVQCLDNDIYVHVPFFSSDDRMTGRDLSSDVPVIDNWLTPTDTLTIR